MAGESLERRTRNSGTTTCHCPGADAGYVAQEDWSTLKGILCVIDLGKCPSCSLFVKESWHQSKKRSKWIWWALFPDYVVIPCMRSPSTGPLITSRVPTLHIRLKYPELKLPGSRPLLDALMEGQDGWYKLWKLCCGSPSHPGFQWQMQV